MSTRASPPLPFTRALLCALCLLTVAACGTLPEASRNEAYTSRQNPIQSARALLAGAAGEASPQRDLTRIRAAGLLADNGRPREAEAALKEINAAALETPALADYTLLYAHIALADERFLQVRNLLNNQQLANNLGEMSPDQRREWHRLRGELFALLGDDLASVAEHSRLAALLRGEDERLAVHDRIWHSLSQVPESGLRAAIRATSDPAVNGWLRLALATRSGQGDIARQLTGIEAWRQANPGHPAAKLLPTSLQQAAAARGDLPDHLALLLPLKGNLAAAAEPIRDGMLAAYYGAMADGGKPPRIGIHDTTEGDINALYEQAVADGAELVIGPLAKDQLQTLMARADLPVAVLGLNYVDDTPNPHPNLYQYGLAVGDEARQLADRAWIEGRRSALVIRPDAGWGSTAFDSFRAHWETKGGLLLTTAPYRDDQADHTDFLRSALLLADSQERGNRLMRTLGKKVSYIPRRRKDVDMVLLLAYPDQGRQFKPTLDFLFASDLPVYATSHIYAGSPNPSQDQDLNGIQFTAMPWTLPELADNDLAPQEPLAPAFRNLFAMGVDAYRLHQWLGLLRALPDSSLQGQSGTLAMAGGNRITRTLPIAAFRNGRVVVAPTVAGGTGAAPR